jgi:aryl-alcohol dehydrogenase-like predicted oxidoreductase
VKARPFPQLSEPGAKSERLVGEVVRRHPGVELYVATKVPPKNGTFPAPSGREPAETFPGDQIRSNLEESLRVSGLEAFDVFQFHVWSDEWIGRGHWLETVSDLKEQGKIRNSGVSINDFQPKERLLPACQEHGVGVSVRVALDEGGLTGRICAEARSPRRTSGTAASVVTGRRRSSGE